MPAITFFILIKAAKRLDFTEEQTEITISAFPHMEEDGQEKVIRHYEMMGDYLFDFDDEAELAKLEALKDG